MLKTLSQSLLPSLLNMSLSASVVIVFVLLLRLLLRSAPKRWSYLLWLAPFFRLLCPLSISGRFSLLGMLEAPVEQRTPVVSAVTYLPTISMEPSFKLDSMQPPISNSLNGSELTVLLYLAGFGAIAAYSLWSCFHLHRVLQTAVPWRPGVFLADHLESPFVLGLLRPKIYLPSDLPEANRRLILLHERHHLQRKDHIIKLLAFIALAIHWFNPLVWLAFFLLGQDMEMSCDEAVLSKLDTDVRADYSTALLSLATGRPIIAGAPLAFGEGDAKSRIKNVLKWKRPRICITLSAALLCVGALVFCLLNPHGAQAIQPPPDLPSTEDLPPREEILPCDKDLIRERGGILLPENDPESYTRVEEGYSLLYIPKGDPDLLKVAWKVGNKDLLSERQLQKLSSLVNGEYPVNAKGKSYGSAELEAYVGYRPDLVPAIGTNGEKGYISSRRELNLRNGETGTIPLYDIAGNIIGEFEVGGVGGGAFGRTIEQVKEDIASGLEDQLNPGGVVAKIPPQLFGGLYFNEEHEMIVQVVEGYEDDICALLQKEIEAGAVLKSVPYSLSQLEQMKQALTPYMSEYHIVSMVVNDRANSLDVAISQESPRLNTLLESLEAVDTAAIRVQLRENLEPQNID